MACRSCGWRACPFAGAPSRTKNKIRRQVSCTYGTTWRKVRLPWLRLPPFPGPDPRFSSPGAAPVAAAAPSRRRNLPTPHHSPLIADVGTCFADGPSRPPAPSISHTPQTSTRHSAFDTSSPSLLSSNRCPLWTSCAAPALYHRVPEGPGDSNQTRQARCRGSRSRLARASGAL